MTTALVATLGISIKTTQLLLRQINHEMGDSLIIQPSNKANYQNDDRNSLLHSTISYQVLRKKTKIVVVKASQLVP